MAARARRTGRGRLSSIERLPPEAADAVAWAYGALRESPMHQTEILEEFNRLLAEIGEGPISRSAFNRHSLRLAADARRLEDTRKIAAALTERLEAGDSDDLTVMVAETIKTLVFELLEAGGEAGFSPKQAMELARALSAAASAQSVSSERRRKAEKELADKAAKAVDAVAKEKGLTADTVEAIKARILFGVERAPA